MGRAVRRTATAAVLVGLSCLAGCALLMLPTDLPAALETVMADAQSFATASDDPLRDVAAGTVRDDLNSLDGCWGGYQRWAGNAGQALEIYEVLQFDAGTQTLTRYVLQQLAGLAMVDVQHGTYEVAASGDQIAFHVKKVESSVPLGPHGQMTDITNQYDTLPQYTVHATLSGDQLKTRFEMPAGDPRTPAGFADDTPLLHRRFDCPAE